MPKLSIALVFALSFCLPVAAAEDGCPSPTLVFRHGKICYEPPLRLAAGSVEPLRNGLRSLEETVCAAIHGTNPSTVRLVTTVYAPEAIEGSDKSSVRFETTARVLEEEIGALVTRCEGSNARITSESVEFANTSEPSEAEMALLAERLRTPADLTTLVASKEILVDLGPALAGTESTGSCPGWGEIAERWEASQDDSGYFYDHFWATGFGDGATERPLDYSAYADCQALAEDGELVECGKPRACPARQDASPAG